MTYVQVVLGLPLEGPFDYSLPEEASSQALPGCRVWVPWRNEKKLAYIIRRSRRSAIARVRQIHSLIDTTPLLSHELLALTKRLSDYYCCSWGLCIDTALPVALRKGRGVALEARSVSVSRPSAAPTAGGIVLVHDEGGNARWDSYGAEIVASLNAGKSVLFLAPDADECCLAQKRLTAMLSVPVTVIERSSRDELAQWCSIRSGAARVVVASRSGVFVPLSSPGLIIVDNEEHAAYKQEQTPHYHAREVALMRSEGESVRVVLGSATPSLESWHLMKKGRAGYLRLPAQPRVRTIQLLETHRLSRYESARFPVIPRMLQDAVSSALATKGKALIFINRTGFATYASCLSCGKVLRCPDCAGHLVYHYRERRLRCHHCSYTTPVPELCPHCNAGYIKYAGYGAEKIESELHRLFPQTRIALLGAANGSASVSADIVIATRGTIPRGDATFEVVGALSIDTLLNRVDFRAAEKAFQCLWPLAQLADKKMIIPTALSGYHPFQALIAGDPTLFYERELAERKGLRFPPHQHLGLIKVRGSKVERVREASRSLFDHLTASNTGGRIKLLSLSPSPLQKLRGNFYWQILISASSAERLSAFLKRCLPQARYSGIIVTVDIDPL